jgi:hypothetical protein
MNRIGVISFNFGCGCWLRSAFYSHDEREAARSTSLPAVVCGGPLPELIVQRLLDDLSSGDVSAGHQRLLLKPYKGEVLLSFFSVPATLGYGDVTTTALHVPPLLRL